MHNVFVENIISTISPLAMQVTKNRMISTEEGHVEKRMYKASMVRLGKCLNRVVLQGAQSG